MSVKTVSRKRFEEVKSFFNRKSIYRQLKSLALGFVSGKNKEIKLVLNHRGENYTDGKTVVVSLFDFAYDYSFAEIFSILKACVGHEVAHVLYSNFNFIKSFVEETADFLNVKHNVPKRFGETLAKHVQNSLEDGRIERIHATRYHGILKHFKFLRTVWWENMELQGDEPEYATWATCILTLATTGMWPKGFDPKKYSEVAELVTSLMPHIHNAVYANDALTLNQEATIIFKKSGDFLEKCFEDELSDEEMEKLADFLNEMISSHEHQSSEMSRTQMKNLKEELDELDEDEMQLPHSGPSISSAKPSNTQSSDANDNQDNDDNESSNGEGQSSSEKQDKKEPSNGQGQSSDEKQDHDDNDSSSGQNSSEDKGQSLDEKHDKDDSDASNGQNSSDDKGQSNKTQKDTSDSQNKEDKGDDDAEGDNPSDSKKNNAKDKKTDNKGDKEDKLSDSSEGDSSSDSQTDDSQNDKNSSNGQPKSDKSAEERAREIEEALEKQKEANKDFLKEVMEGLKEDLKRADVLEKRIQEEELKQTVGDDVEIEAGKFCELDGYKYSFKQHYFVASQVPVSSEIKRRARMLRQKLEQLLFVEEHSKSNRFNSGRLNATKLWRLGIDEADVFYKKQNEAKDYVATLLIDVSGSMSSSTKNGTRYSDALMSASIIEEALRDLVPFNIILFTTSGDTVVHHNIKGFKGSKFNHCQSFFSEHPYAFNANNDAVSIAIAAEKLAKRPEQEKLLFVISDGQPAHYGLSGAQGIALTKQSVDDARKKGVKTIGIAIGEEDHLKYNEEAYRAIYGKSLVLTETEKITSTLAKLLDVTLR